MGLNMMQSNRHLLLLLRRNSPVLAHGHLSWQVIPVAGVTNWKPPKTYEDVEYPERRKLKLMERAPQPTPGVKPPKMFRRLIDMRGPELVNNKLIHKQYGIRALSGGQMHYGHFEMARLFFNRKMEENRMFGIWRIDAPWKPITKKGQGHRMGGGKGSIDRYVTPVKSGRIIIEVGGACGFQEVEPILSRIAAKLPFKAEAISQEMLEKEFEMEKILESQNMNPFTFEYCIKNNMLGCRKWASKYDYIWYGKYR